MSFPQYPEYADSGLNWVGKIPTHWRVAPLKTVATCNDDSLSEQTDPDTEIEYVEIGDVGEVQGIVHTQRMEFANAPSRARRIPREGDVLVSTVRTYLRAITPVRNASTGLVASTGFAVVRPVAEQLSTTFAGYMLRSEWLISEIISRSVGVNYPAIRSEEVMSLRIPVPPLREQEAIADFLDHETARIDALIEEQQRLISLLHEKRQAQISQSVLTSTFSNSDLRHSGRAALGNVPGHWEVMPLRYAIDFLEGPGILAHDFAETGVPLLRIGNLKPGYVELSGCNWLSPEDVASRWQKYRTRTGDLLISGSASTDLISEVDENSQGSIPYTGIIIIRPKSGVMTKEFTKWLLQADEFKVQVDRLKAGSTIQHFGPMHLNQMYLAVPPVDEQEEISERLTDLDFRQSKLIQSAREGVELLESRRSSLISAAVTGKIDVRDSDQPTPSDEEVFPQVAEKEGRYG